MIRAACVTVSGTSSRHHSPFMRIVGPETLTAANTLSSPRTGAPTARILISRSSRSRPPSRFAPEVAAGDYVVAGHSFGSGSSREHAPLSLVGAGVSGNRRYGDDRGARSSTATAHVQCAEGLKTFRCVERATVDVHTRNGNHDARR